MIKFLIIKIKKRYWILDMKKIDRQIDRKPMEQAKWHWKQKKIDEIVCDLVSIQTSSKQTIRHSNSCC